MTFLLDQDVPEDLTYLLRQLGHEVLRVRDVLGPEAADSLVLQFAFEGDSLLVTCSRDDFLALAERQPITESSSSSGGGRGPKSAPPSCGFCNGPARPWAASHRDPTECPAAARLLRPARSLPAAERGTCTRLTRHQGRVVGVWSRTPTVPAVVLSPFALSGSGSAAPVPAVASRTVAAAGPSRCTRAGSRARLVRPCQRRR